MAVRDHIRPIAVRGRALWTQGNVTHLTRPPAQEAPAKPLDQYRQDIWKSFPHLRAPGRTLAVHPYHLTEE